MTSVDPYRWKIRPGIAGARWLLVWFLLALPLAPALANDELAALEAVKGTVYVRNIPNETMAGGRQCGFDFLVIARDPANGQPVQLKGRFVASQDAQGALYGWSGVLFDGLRPGQAGRAPGRILVQPVNGMQVKQPPPVPSAGSETLQYREPVDADFQLLLTSIVRDRGLKLRFSRESDGALIETMLDLDVSGMEWQNGRVSRQFDSRVPAQMGRCWSSRGS